MLNRSVSLAGAALVVAYPSCAQAQHGATPAGPSASDAQSTASEDEETEEIVVTGQRARGSVIGDIPPENLLDSRDVRATGATNVDELLEAIAPQIGSARGRGGERPILLLNGQRTSSFREVHDLPAEAIQRVEILPEEVALKYGYRADQRVVNIILRQRFRSTAVRAEARAATEAGYFGGLADVTRLQIDRSGRTNFTVRAEGNSALTEAERDIQFKSTIGNPNLDSGRATTLVGSRSLFRAGATHNRTMFGNVSASLNGELEHSEGESLLGYPTFPDGAPILVPVDPRERDTASDTGHIGLVLNGGAQWRWTITGNADLERSVTNTDPNESLVSLRDRARSTTKSAESEAVINGTLLKLPAGEAGLTLRFGASTFDVDSTSRRREGGTTSASLGRSEGNAAVSLDLPVSRRNRDFSALGNLTVNGNAEIKQLSDFGSLTTVGAGLNWSPANPVNLIASWTREEGAPSMRQLGDPVLETPDSRIFDFVAGETAIVTAISGGNPDLQADRRNVLKVGGNWKPWDQLDLRFRGEFVRSHIKDPISSFAAVNAALEAAFPERFARDESGRLVSVDLRPVNFDQAKRDTIRWGVDFSKPLRSRRPTAAQVQSFHSRLGEAAPPAMMQGVPSADGPPPGEGPPPDIGRSNRGGSFGRMGGGRGQRGRLSFSLTHTLTLKDKVVIRPGLPELDYLNGDAFGATGGRPRHEVEAQAGWSNNGLGARLSANWRSGTRVDSASAGSLRFSPLATFDLRFFANLGERFDIVSKRPWLRNTQLRVEARNLFDSKPKVRDSAGVVPVNYQPDLLDPLGRTLMISIRKMFLPPRGVIQRDREEQR